MNLIAISCQKNPITILGNSDLKQEHEMSKHLLVTIWSRRAVGGNSRAAGGQQAGGRAGGMWELTAEAGGKQTGGRRGGKARSTRAAGRWAGGQQMGSGMQSVSRLEAGAAGGKQTGSRPVGRRLVNQIDGRADGRTFDGQQADSRWTAGGHQADIRRGAHFAHFVMRIKKVSFSDPICCRHRGHFSTAVSSNSMVFIYNDFSSIDSVSS
jgi:hypothetical protein